jgi:hypothetical protein
MLHVARRLPSGAHATARTQPVWPARVRYGVPVSESQIRAVLSPEPVARRVGDEGEKEAARIGWPWPGMRWARRDTACTRKMDCGSAARVRVVSKGEVMPWLASSGRRAEGFVG